MITNTFTIEEQNNPDCDITFIRRCPELYINCSIEPPCGCKATVMTQYRLGPDEVKKLQQMLKDWDVENRGAFERIEARETRAREGATDE